MLLRYRLSIDWYPFHNAKKFLHPFTRLNNFLTISELGSSLSHPGGHCIVRNPPDSEYLKLDLWFLSLCG